MPMLLVLESQSDDFKSLSPQLRPPLRVLQSGCNRATSTTKICPVQVAWDTTQWRYTYWYWYWVTNTGEPKRNIRCTRTSTTGIHVPTVVESCEVARYGSKSTFTFESDSLVVGKYEISSYKRRSLPRQMCFYCKVNIMHTMRHFRSRRHVERIDEVIEDLAAVLGVPPLCMRKIMGHLDYDPLISAT
jgi:hypothetical protein